MKNNIPGFFSVSQRNSQPSHAEYQEIMGRAKIGLNFSESSVDHQTKGRIFENMLSGAMLLESENHLTETLFTEGKDYVSFTTKEDLVEKIKFYLRTMRRGFGLLRMVEDKC